MSLEQEPITQIEFDFNPSQKDALRSLLRMDLNRALFNIYGREELPILYVYPDKDGRVGKVKHFFSRQDEDEIPVVSSVKDQFNDIETLMDLLIIANARVIEYIDVDGEKRIYSPKETQRILSSGQNFEVSSQDTLFPVSIARGNWQMLIKKSKMFIQRNGEQKELTGIEYTLMQPDSYLFSPNLV